MTACLGLSWWLRDTKPQWAMGIVSIPAALLALFALYAVVGSMVNKDWK
jgi:hypothetical protein